MKFQFERVLKLVVKATIESQRTLGDVQALLGHIRTSPSILEVLEQ